MAGVNRQINDFINRKMSQAKARIANMIVRFVLDNVTDSTGIQQVKGTALVGEVKEELEHFQNFGFTSSALRS